jgi:pimeloyl-ACP methyl ester carboxylesterase
VFLVGQSGGGAMAAWVAESMPRMEQVDGVIMLSASLSPQYMLDVALGRSKRGIVSFYSLNDWLLLGFGTTFIGTMDGEHTSSAGRTGFDRPTSVIHPVPAYDKLYQVPWKPQMAQAGNSGGHLGGGASDFVATYVAPLILAPEWNTQVIDDIVNANAPPTATSKNAK